MIRFWKVMMDKYGTEKEYNRQLINAFKYGDPSDPEEDAPEIIIVVHKLLTGFDAPCDTVLYLARQLKEHSLLQAIARVNRLHDGKECGYVLDYRGVLENLDHALDMYNALPEFDEEDLEGTMTDVREIVHQLPQKHSVLWDIFKGIENKRDEEAFERLLADDALRVQFYERFAEFARTLGVAFSTESFLGDTPDKKVDEYRSELKFFQELRRSVRRRYAEVIDFSEYEPKIRKLLDTHLGTEGMEQIVGAIDLLSEQQRDEALAKTQGEAAKADMIAHNVKRILEVKWQREDPAFYEKFSRMLQNVINAFRADRLRAAEYFKSVLNIEKNVLQPSDEDVPDKIKHRELTTSFFRNIHPVFERAINDSNIAVDISVDASTGISSIIDERRIVNWIYDNDVQNRMRQDIEDCLFELKDKYGFDLSFEQIDLVMDRCIEIAKVRCP